MKAASDRAVSVWGREFLLINATLFIAAAGLALFFDFQRHLELLGMPAFWIGPLISADGLAGLVVQIAITPFLHAHNARRGMMTGAIMLALAMACYPWAVSPGAMLMVRLMHGAGFVVLVSSLMAALVHVIPEGKSGYAFGIVSTTRLLPYAVVPLLLGLLPAGVTPFGTIVLCAAAGMLGLLLLVAPLHPKASVTLAGPQTHRPPFRAQWQNLMAPRVLVLMLQTLLLSSGFAIVFFYIRQYAALQGLQHAGLFFALATVMMIVVRLIGAPFMDRFDKRRMTIGGLVLLVLAFALLFALPGSVSFLACGIMAGLGWGIAMPVVSAMLFDVSPPAFRGFNVNAAMVMVQASFFVGPMLGGLVLAVAGYGALFAGCAVLSLIGAGVMMGMPTSAQTGEAIG